MREALKIKMPPTPEQEVMLVAAASEGAVVDALNAIFFPGGAPREHVEMILTAEARLYALQGAIMRLEAFRP